MSCLLGIYVQHGGYICLLYWVYMPTTVDIYIHQNGNIRQITWGE